MNNVLHILMAQQNYTVGAIENNTQQILDVVVQYQSKVDMIVFSELAITGYPPEDWLFRAEFQHDVDDALKKIQAAVEDVYVIVGHPALNQAKRFNAVSILHKGKKIAQYYKRHLPNYGIFDEKRYFESGSEACVFLVKGKRVGVVICEDLWAPGPWEETVNAGAELIVSPNASPFERHKSYKREEIIRLRQSAEGRVPVVYVNTVGGQDELVFDGQSFVMNELGEVCCRAKAFEADLSELEYQFSASSGNTIFQHDAPDNSIAMIYQALVLGTRDYIYKNGFKGAIVGLSGGIDSALTLAIAVDALGADCVEAVMMPSRYTADISLEDAKAEINALQVAAREISIEPAFEAFLSSLGISNSICSQQLTLQNIQARCRGILLMALSNETGKLLLTTGNKSEMAMGYCTLYGDMAGSLAVLKDVLKTWVYRLSNYRNSLSKTPIIPQRVIERAPSAELAFDQKDEDSLPPYDILDNVLEQYIEKNKSPADIIHSGVDAAIVQRVISLLHQNEYKRRQSAPGIKVSSCAFGRDWRYPLTSGRRKFS